MEMLPVFRKSELPRSKVAKMKKEDLKTGPLSVLDDSVKNNTKVLIYCRNTKKLLGCVRAFDEHYNMVLENVTEIWTDIPRFVRGKRVGKSEIKDRFISKMFLRGDSVIMVLENPQEAAARKKKTMAGSAIEEIQKTSNDQPKN